MQTSAKRAVGYVRVSTDEQVEGKSLTAQRQSIAGYAESHGMELVHVYADEGVSAHVDSIAKRPDFSRLLEDAKSGLFDVVVVHTLDRWARNLRIQGESLTALGRADVGFVSITESWDYSTPSGQMALNVMGSVSQFFSAQLGVHVSKSQLVRAQMGLPVGPVPFGYAVDESGRAQVTPDCGEAVIEVFRRRAEGQSMPTIAAWLNDQGFETTRGNRFTAHAIKDMLNCRFYAGMVKYGDSEYEGVHDALVDEQLWRDVQSRRATPTARRVRGEFLGALQGLVRCAACGRPLQSHVNAGRFPLYRERHAHPCVTNEKTVGAKKIDAQLGAVFTALVLPPSIAADAVTAAAAGPDAEKAKRSLTERRRRIGQLYADGVIDERKYRNDLTTVDDQLRKLAPTTPLKMELVAELCTKLNRLWDVATSRERHELIAALVEEVYIDLHAKRAVAVRPRPDVRLLVESAVALSKSGLRVISETEFAGEELALVGLVETGEN